jgi:hypothetical protein
MRPLGARDILHVWERGELLASWERPLLLLAMGEHGGLASAFAELPLGERDARLIELRERTFGRTLQIYTACPACAERYELSLDTAELLERGRPSLDTETELVEGPFRLRFRLPNSRDLVALRALLSGDDPRRALAARCVSSAMREEEVVDSAELPEPVLVALAREMELRDPLAEIRIALDCAECGAAWQPRLDIAEFLWAEVRALARRLVTEVATLARLYAWREDDILEMSAWRRRAYLELGGA